MKRKRMKEALIKQPTGVNKLTLDELYDETSRDWETKAADLRTRRLQKLKKKSSGHH